MPNNKEKIIGTAITVPIIAASTMTGACAGGCPYGLVSDPFPGQCGRYIDLNGDGICDLSQSVAATPTNSTTHSSSQSSTHSSQNTATGSSGGSDIQNGSSDYANTTTTVQDPSSGSLDGTSSNIDGSNYHVLPVTLLIIGAYLFTYYLFRKGILKPQKHKRLWNLLLMGGYLGTGVTGILLIVFINMGISTIYNQGITFWHAELAILMVVGTLIHIHIYQQPFKKMFNVFFSFKSDSENENNLNSPNNSK
ncbi:MAG: hypothetical protein HZC47_01160 [Methanobacterium sp.]|nr:hypothetical protein [Methanobacterium sp.]